MGRPARLLRAALGVVLVASCGGSAFTTGAGSDAGDDVTTSAPDGAGDTAVTDDSSSSGGPEASPAEAGAEGGGADASGDAPGEATVADAPHDVAEEPPPVTCAGASACVPAVPSGWSGPVELYAGSSAPPACTTSFTSAYDGNGDLTASPATCSCSCGPSVTQCSSPKLSFYSAVCVAGNGCTCSGTACYTTTLQAGACTTVSDTNVCSKLGTPAMTAPASVAATGATCPPVSGEQTTPATWGTFAQACSSTVTIAQVDCQAGSVCAPKPAAPYGPLCISQAGDVACPNGGYTTKQTYYGGLEDSRGCSSCTCEPPTGASCGATIEAFSSTDGTCAGLPTTYAAPFTCDPVDQPTDMRLVTTPQNGSCLASSVTATGSVTAASPTTFCCLP
ncbi:MAG TPA: hypothetical protein VGL81_21250 [Polyangiaceae bacterium]|jgi:hypothetical protein